MGELQEPQVPNPEPVLPTKEPEVGKTGIALSRKDVVLLILSCAPSLAGLNSDPVIVVPMLALSIGSFIYLCATHPGRLLLRIGIGALFTLVICFVGVRALAWQNIVSRMNCNIYLGESAGMSARGYASGPITPNGRLVKITSQTLFYNWNLTLAPSRTFRHAIVTVNNFRKSDKLHVDPDGYTVSDLYPHWFSGFEELGRDPDYYSRAIEFAEVKKGTNYHISLKRQITSPTIRAGDIVRFSLSSSGCKLRPDPPDRTKTEDDSAIFLTNQARRMAIAYPVVSEPPRPKDGFQVMIEFECANPSCSNTTKGPLDGLQMWIGAAKP